MTKTNQNQSSPLCQNAHDDGGLGANPSPCLVMGDNIDAVTTAVVLASLNQSVSVYADTERLNFTLKQYAFEHHVQALWQLYMTQKRIAIIEPNNTAIDKLINKEGVTWQILWLFYHPIELGKEHENENSWQLSDTFLEHKRQDASAATSWLIHCIDGLNSAHNQNIPIILSGIAPLGLFAQFAESLHRAWVYYVPFVFMQDGQAFNAMLSPKLWLTGEKTPNTWHRLQALQPLIQHAKATQVADIATIEFARSSIMGMLATRVSYINEMSRLADIKGVDITLISQIMGMDERIGGSYLQAGWGFGGRTLPSELAVLTQDTDQNQIATPLLEAVQMVNDDQKELIFRKLWQYFDGVIEHRQITIWGGGYKSGSGRTLGSAIHPLLRLLWSYDITTFIYAEEATTELKQLYDTHLSNNTSSRFITSPYELLAQSQALIILTWSASSLPIIGEMNKVAIPVFDAGNILSSKQIHELNADYFGIGR